MENHTHGPDGAVILSSPIEISPDAAEVVMAEPIADASVEIAKIEADRDIKISAQDTKRAEVLASEELAELRGKVSALQDAVDALTPPPVEPAEMVPPPAPIIVEDQPATEPVPPETANKPNIGKKKSEHFWF